MPHSPAFDSCFALLERLHQRGRVAPLILLGPRLRQVEPRAEAAIRRAGVPYRRVSVLGLEVMALRDIARADAVLTHADPLAYGKRSRLRDAAVRRWRKPTVFVQHGMIQAGLHYAGVYEDLRFHSDRMLLWAPLPDPNAPFLAETLERKQRITGFLKVDRLGPWAGAARLRAAFRPWRKRLLVCHNFAFEPRLFPVAGQKRMAQALSDFAARRPDVLLVLRGHRGRSHAGNRDFVGWLSDRHANVMVSDRHSGPMRMATVHDVMAEVDGVITHPSTVVLDAVYANCPLGVFDCRDPALAGLPRTETADEIEAFLEMPDARARAAPVRAAYGALPDTLDRAASEVEAYLEGL
jgi:hypothetical protein